MQKNILPSENPTIKTRKAEKQVSRPNAFPLKSGQTCKSFEKKIKAQIGLSVKDIDLKFQSNLFLQLFCKPLKIFEEIKYATFS